MFKHLIAFTHTREKKTITVKKAEKILKGYQLFFLSSFKSYFTLRSKPKNFNELKKKYNIKQRTVI